MTKSESDELGPRSVVSDDYVNRSLMFKPSPRATRFTFQHCLSAVTTGRWSRASSRLCHPSFKPALLRHHIHQGLATAPHRYRRVESWLLECLVGVVDLDRVRTETVRQCRKPAVCKRDLVQLIVGNILRCQEGIGRIVGSIVCDLHGHVPMLVGFGE